LTGRQLIVGTVVTFALCLAASVLELAAGDPWAGSVMAGIAVVAAFVAGDAVGAHRTAACLWRALGDQPLDERDLHEALRVELRRRKASLLSPE